MITINDISPMDNTVFMQMKEGDRLMSEAYAEISPESTTAELVFIRENEPNLLYDMGKAILNALDLKGVKRVVCIGGVPEITLKALRFKADAEGYLLSLEGYFTSDCTNK